MPVLYGSDTTFPTAGLLASDAIPGHGSPLKLPFLGEIRARDGSGLHSESLNPSIGMWGGGVPCEGRAPSRDLVHCGGTI